MDKEIHRIKSYLDEDQEKEKIFQHDLENKGQKINRIEEFLNANQEQDNNSRNYKKILKNQSR